VAVESILVVRIQVCAGSRTWRSGQLLDPIRQTQNLPIDLGTIQGNHGHTDTVGHRRPRGPAGDIVEEHPLHMTQNLAPFVAHGSTGPGVRIVGHGHVQSS